MKILIISSSFDTREDITSNINFNIYFSLYILIFLLIKDFYDDNTSL